jgi:hypothetical protein
MVITLKRIWIAGLLCAAATIPVAAMSAFLFGCCALPFHHVLHRYLPICGAIVRHMTPDSHHDSMPGKIAPKKQALVSILAARADGVVVLHTRRLAATRIACLRDQISHGALRCDDDVGLLLLLSVMLV